MRLGAAAVREKEVLADYILMRLRAGVDPRALVIGHAAVLGGLVAKASVNEAHVNITLEVLGQVMRESAQIEAPAVGHG